MPLFALSHSQRVAASILGALFLSAACMGMAASMSPLAFLPPSGIA